MIQWGDVATWVQAIGTLALFTWGLWAWRRDVDRRWREQERQQADGVAVYPSSAGITGYSKVTLVNTTKLPIFNVVIALVDRTGQSMSETQILQRNVIAPGESVEADLPAYEMHIEAQNIIGRFTDAHPRQWEKPAIGELVRTDHLAGDHWKALQRPVPGQLPSGRS